MLIRLRKTILLCRAAVFFVISDIILSGLAGRAYLHTSQLQVISLLLLVYMGFCWYIFVSVGLDVFARTNTYTLAGAGARKCKFLSHTCLVPPLYDQLGYRQGEHPSSFSVCVVRHARPTNYIWPIHFTTILSFKKRKFTFLSFKKIIIIIIHYRRKYFLFKLTK